VVVHVTVSSQRAVDRVVVEVKPANVTASMLFDPSRGVYAATLTVPAVSQIVKATAYSGKTRVGNVDAEVPVARDRSASVYLRVLDMSAGWPVPQKRPIITSMVTSLTVLAADEQTAVSANAVDATRSTIAYRWSSSCGGTFANPAAAATAWRPDAPGGCAITVQASSAAGKTTRSEGVTVIPLTGSVAVSGEFIAWPHITDVDVESQAGACSVARTDPDGSCRVTITSGEAVLIRAHLDARPDALPTMADSCGGSFDLVDESGWPSSAAYRWTAPRVVAATVCTVVPAVSLLTMVDEFSVAILITP
jgi:hypothetical protein